jgi:hypothetical protein
MGDDILSVTVTVGSKEITLKGPKDFVTEEVRRLTSSDEPGASALGAKPNELPSGRLTERDLIRSKAPHGHAETVTVLGYALVQAGATEFGETEIKKAYLRAHVRPPKVIAQALRDAKNKYDFLKAGTTKGNYSLTDHGERTVIFDLPRQKGG